MTRPLAHPGLWAHRYARIALGAAFLSGIASRFGLWGKGVGYGDFAHFVQYTAEVNSFMPAATIPFLAWAATAAELGLGLMLVLGIQTRWAAWGSAALLFLFGAAMTISFGIKSPLDYSVFSGSAAAVLLALHAPAEARRRALAPTWFHAVPVDGCWIDPRPTHSLEDAR